jgi:pimeloyl-ACP methyl ester carboxylesterase
MLLLPFQVLGVWLRGLFALALIAVGVWLLRDWYSHRETVVRVPASERTRDDAERRPEPGAEPPAPPDRGTDYRVEPWRFGWNRATASLLGGLALLGFSLGGGWAGTTLLRRGGERPNVPHGEVRRVPGVDGADLHVELFGPADGPPVVLTHGWGLDSGEWCYAVKHLADRYRVIVWDLPGLGRSGRPATNDWSLEKLAADLETVLGLAGGRPAVLVGHSIGGMILLTLCRLRGPALVTRVSGLVLAHTTYTNPVETTKRAALYRALQKPVLEPLCHLMVWLAPVVWLMDALSYLNGSAHRSTDRQSFAGTETRGQLDFMARYYLKAWPGVIGRGMLAMFRYDATTALGVVPVPALVVSGDRDELCTPQASDVIGRSVPRAQLLSLSPARHCGLFEHNGRFDDAVRTFANAVTGATSAAG